MFETADLAKTAGAAAPAPMAIAAGGPDRDFDAVHLRLLERSAARLIRYGLRIAHRPVVSTSFGPLSAAFLHLIARHAPGVPVVWVDTGYNTAATLAFAARVGELLSLDLHVYRPRPSVRLDFPPEPDTPEHAAFTDAVKLEPFSRAVRELQPDLWFSAIRHDQTAHRAAQTLILRTRSGLIKASPLLNWRDADVGAYLRRYGLPDEPDYVDPTKGDLKRECGLHLKF